jgi:hypothetical protein
MIQEAEHLIIFFLIIIAMCALPIVVTCSQFSLVFSHQLRRPIPGQGHHCWLCWWRLDELSTCGRVSKAILIRLSLGRHMPLFPSKTPPSHLLVSLVPWFLCALWFLCEVSGGCIVIPKTMPLFSPNRSSWSRVWRFAHIWLPTSLTTGTTVKLIDSAIDWLKETS